ncbi:MAG: site-specific integrase [Zoogloeaceae bacterium]|jgi:integrase|nr:site-specific integrase [Zoogloeaceae bacterium]
MASIIKTPDGRYRAHVFVQGQRKSRVFRTKREADAWAAQTETGFRKEQDAMPGERFTLADALKRYRDEVSPSKRGERWERVRIGAFLESSSFPSALTLSSVTPPVLAVWRDDRLKSVSAGTVIREFGLLSAVFETARREWQWITANPARDVKKPPSPAHRERVITRQEVRAMLRVMGYTRKIRAITHAVAVCFLLALRTGMRAGELCSLTWENVHDGYCRLPVTKTKPRDVPLTRKAMRLIGRMRGWDDVLVFDLKKETLDALFRKYREKAGLSGFTFHDTRHTAATWIAGRMNSSGIPAQQALLDMCKMFGWSDTSRALTYYNPSAADIARRME